MSKNRIDHDKWLSEMLQCPAYRISVPENRVEISRFEVDLAKLLEERPLFAFAKVDPAKLTEVHLLEQYGFRLIDTNTQFDKPLQTDSQYAGNCTVRFALAEDEEQAVVLGRNCFSYSRFHLDPLMPKEVADRIKGEWVRNYFTGKRGDAMVLAEIDGMVVGFLQLIYAGNETLIIDLIAVDDNHRRKGIAGDMIQFAEANCGNFPKIIVGTQIANVPSMRMYENLGFKISSASYVFHYHG